MKTNHITPEEMTKRVSKFKELEPLAIQKDANIPTEGRDVVYARQLLSVIGLDPAEGNTPINAGAPIVGAGGITMTHAKCPPPRIVGQNVLRLLQQLIELIQSNLTSLSNLKRWDLSLMLV